MTGTTTSISYDGVDALAPTRPSGRAVPKAARDLVEFARDAGWLSLVQWCEAADGSPYLSVQLGLREPRHHYQLSWHSFDQLDATTAVHPYRLDRRPLAGPAQPEGPAARHRPAPAGARRAGR